MLQHRTGGQPRGRSAQEDGGVKSDSSNPDVMNVLNANGVKIEIRRPSAGLLSNNNNSNNQRPSSSSASKKGKKTSVASRPRTSSSTAFDKPVSRRISTAASDTLKEAGARVRRLSPEETKTSEKRVTLFGNDSIVSATFDKKRNTENLRAMDEALRAERAAQQAVDQVAQQQNLITQLGSASLANPNPLNLPEQAIFGALETAKRLSQQEQALQQRLSQMQQQVHTVQQQLYHIRASSAAHSRNPRDAGEIARQALQERAGGRNSQVALQYAQQRQSATMLQAEALKNAQMGQLSQSQQQRLSQAQQQAVANARRSQNFFSQARASQERFWAQRNSAIAAQQQQWPGSVQQQQQWHESRGHNNADPGILQYNTTAQGLEHSGQSSSKTTNSSDYSQAQHQAFQPKVPFTKEQHTNRSSHTKHHANNKDPQDCPFEVVKRGSIVNRGASQGGARGSSQTGQLLKRKTRTTEANNAVSNAVKEFESPKNAPLASDHATAAENNQNTGAKNNKKMSKAERKKSQELQAKTPPPPRSPAATPKASHAQAFVGSPTPSKGHVDEVSEILGADRALPRGSVKGLNKNGNKNHNKKNSQHLNSGGAAVNSRVSSYAHLLGSEEPQDRTRTESLGSHAGSVPPIDQPAEFVKGRGSVSLVAQQTVQKKAQQTGGGSPTGSTASSAHAGGLAARRRPAPLVAVALAEEGGGGGRTSLASFPDTPLRSSYTYSLDGRRSHVARVKRDEEEEKRISSRIQTVVVVADAIPPEQRVQHPQHFVQRTKSGRLVDLEVGLQRNVQKLGQNLLDNRQANRLSATRLASGLLSLEVSGNPNGKGGVSPSFSARGKGDFSDGANSFTVVRTNSFVLRERAAMESLKLATTTPPWPVSSTELRHSRMGLVEFKDRVSVLYDEFIVGGDYAAFRDQVVALNCREFHDALAWVLFRKSLDIRSQETAALDYAGAAVVLRNLYREQRDILSVSALFRGLYSWISQIEELEIDVPHASFEIANLLENFVEESILEPAVLCRIPAQLLEKTGKEKYQNILSEMAIFKTTVHDLLVDYFDKADLNTLVEEIESLNMPTYHHELVSEALLLACDYGREERRLVAKLAGELLRRGVLVEQDVQHGIALAVGQVDNLMATDVPLAPTYFVQCLSQMVLEEVISADLVKKFRMLSYGGSRGDYIFREVLHRTPEYSRKIWGPPDSSSNLLSLETEIETSIQEYLDSNDLEEVSRIVGELHLTKELDVFFLRELLLKCMQNRKMDGQSSVTSTGRTSFPNAPGHIEKMKKASVSSSSSATAHSRSATTSHNKKGKKSKKNEMAKARTQTREDFGEHDAGSQERSETREVKSPAEMNGGGIKLLLHLTSASVFAQQDIEQAIEHIRNTEADLVLDFPLLRKELEKTTQLLEQYNLISAEFYQTACHNYDV